jgi:hypothetical protein
VATFIVLAIDCEIKFLSENMRYRLWEKNERTWEIWKGIYGT